MGTRDTYADIDLISLQRIHVEVLKCRVYEAWITAGMAEMMRAEGKGYCVGDVLETAVSACQYAELDGLLNSPDIITHHSVYKHRSLSNACPASRLCRKPKSSVQ